jgi:hypothetical protein
VSIQNPAQWSLNWLSSLRPRQLRHARVLLTADTEAAGRELTGVTPVLTGTRDFTFAFEPRYRGMLGLLGIRPENTRLRVGPEHLHVRFGPWSVRTPLDNVRGAELTGPYHAMGVIGVRVSPADRGIVFGSSTLTGVCVRFHEPVRGLEPVGLLKHPSLTVTAVESRELARLLRELAHPGR